MMSLDQHQELASVGGDSMRVVVAGPGAGKTRIIARRASWFVSSGWYAGHQVVALTYTRSMANDLAVRIRGDLEAAIACGACGGSGRIHRDGVDASCGWCGGSGHIEVSAPTVGTLHSVAARLLGRTLRGELAGRDEVLELGWLPDSRSDGRVDFGIATPEDVDDLVQAAYLNARKKIKKKDLKAGLRWSGAELLGWPPEAATRQELVRRGLLSYDDLLVCLERIVTSVPMPGGAPHLGEVLPCVIIDEGQDMAPAHWHIMECWSPRHLTIAGDDGQEIYGFMARRYPWDGVGDFSSMARFAHDHDELHSLGRNYRSIADIVAWSDRLRIALADEAICVPVSLTPSGPAEGRMSPACTVSYGSDDDEGGVRTAVAEVTALIDGDPFSGASFAPNEVAVLGRTWDEIDQVASVLRKAGYPVAVPERKRDRWRTLAGRAFVGLARHVATGFLDEVDARTIARLLGHHDPHALVDRCMRIAFQNGWTLAEALDTVPAAVDVPDEWWVAPAKAGGTIGDLVSIADDAMSLGGPALVDAAHAACLWEGPGASVREWLLWIASDESSAQIDRRPDHICATTIHGAKGLEWPAVVVIGACEGGIPAKFDRSDDEKSESGRCLYVAVTRAREALRVIVPRVLRGKPRHPSPWLLSSGLATRNPAAVAGQETE